MSNKLTSNIQTFLQTPKGLKKSWVRTSLTYTLCTILFIVVITLSFIYSPLSKKPDWFGLGTSFYQVVNAPYIEVATWLSVAGLCILTIPFIYLFSVWMIGINQVSISKRFHLFMWIIGFILTLIALVALILLIRASIYSINTSYITISTPDTAPPADSPPSSIRFISIY